jgi:hypothetical protein
MPQNSGKPTPFLDIIKDATQELQMDEMASVHSAPNALKCSPSEMRSKICSAVFIELSLRTHIPLPIGCYLAGLKVQGLCLLGLVGDQSGPKAI